MALPGSRWILSIVPRATGGAHGLRKGPAALLSIHRDRPAHWRPRCPVGGSEGRWGPLRPATGPGTLFERIVGILKEVWGNLVRAAYGRQEIELSKTQQTSFVEKTLLRLIQSVPRYLQAVVGKG